MFESFKKGWDIQSEGEKEKAFLTNAHTEGGTEREKSIKLFFIFDNSEIRDTAINLLNKLRDQNKEFDDDFRFFNGCIIDKERPDVGLEIGFSKNTTNLRTKFEKILVDQGLIPKEEYETIDEIPIHLEEQN